MHAFLVDALQHLIASRPTAVNLKDAVTKLLKISSDATQMNDADMDSVRRAYIEATEKMLVDDVEDNRAIGRYGVTWIKENVGVRGGIRVLTHCNTGFVFLALLFKNAVIMTEDTDLWQRQDMALHLVSYGLCMQIIF